MLKQSFPNIEVVQLPELTTTAGEMLYMTVPDLFGIETGICAFSEKYFLGRVVPEMSSYKQKGRWRNLGRCYSSSQSRRNNAWRLI
ncbi:MAG: hypothetical protein ACLSE8_15640 [Parasutterella sp.]